VYTSLYDGPPASRSVIVPSVPIVTTNTLGQIVITVAVGFADITQITLFASEGSNSAAFIASVYNFSSPPRAALMQLQLPQFKFFTFYNLFVSSHFTPKCDTR
jgi:hypothetical protein